MEALAAVGLAANILQFVDYTCYILKIGKQLRRKGMSDFNADLERSAETLEHQITRIRLQQVTSAGLCSAGPALEDLTKECTSIASEILGFVRRFKFQQAEAPVLQVVPQQRTEHPDENKYRTLRDAAEKDWKALRLSIQQDEDELGYCKTNLQSLLALTSQRKRELEASLKGKNSKNNLVVIQMQSDHSSALQGMSDMEKKIIEIDEKLQLGRTNLRKLHSSMLQHSRDLQKLVNTEEEKFSRKKSRTIDDNDKMLAAFAARQKVKTLAKAVEVVWNKKKIEELADKLDRIRGLLLSEVILNIQISVSSIGEEVVQSSKRLQSIQTAQSDYRMEALDALQQGSRTTESMLRVQSEYLSRLDDNANCRQEWLVRLIESFKDVLQEGFLFPALPQDLLRHDPSLNSAALSGYHKIENRILANLYFNHMEVREAQVQEAYEKTCAWVFEDPKENEKPWDNFREWLENGRGCYWIEGKAGCGKSTLMKFIQCDPRTLAALNLWAGSGKPLIANCFFWRAGTTLQSNQEGLLRSLLYTILAERRDLISRVFPGRYNAMILDEFQQNSDPEIFFTCDSPGCRASFERPGQLNEHRRSQHGEAIPTTDSGRSGNLSLAELKKAFTALSTQPFADFTICLFIDGLDEYIGDQQDIVNLFKASTRHPFLKAVISSRPEGAFVEAFQSCPKLRMEALTSGDIVYYARTMLLSHSKMQSLQTRNPGLATKLIKTISSKASGVFLWVFLVVRLLLERLSDGIYPEELQNVIGEYPEELHSLYEYMFDRMKPQHRLEAFRLFHAVLRAHEIESSIPTALRLSYFERDKPADSVTRPIKAISKDEFEDRMSTFESRLRSRCCGLLEIQYERQHRLPEFQLWDEGRVEFLHRTVSDFLKVPGISQLLDRDALSTHDEMYEGLLSSLLHRFKTWDFFRLKRLDQWEHFVSEIEIFLRYLRVCESHLGSRQTDYLVELNRGLEQLWKVRGLDQRSKAHGQSMATFNTHWAELVRRRLFNNGANHDHEPLLTLAAHFGLNTFVRRRLMTTTATVAEFLSSDGPGLATKIVKETMLSPSLRGQLIQTLECFFEAGLDANSRRPQTQLGGIKTTAWEDLVHLQPSVENAVQFEIWAELPQVYVRSGAMLESRLGRSKRAGSGPTAREVITDALKSTRSLCVPLEDVVTLEQGKTRIENLLAETPSITAEPGPGEENSAPLPRYSTPSRMPVVGEHSPQDSQNGQQRRKPRGDAGKVAKTPEPASTPADHPCSRCQNVDLLKEAGFGVAKIYQALEAEGSESDIVKLANRILSMSDEETPHSSSAATAVRTTPLAEPVKSPATSSKPTGRQWTVVARNSKPPEHAEVVGAQWIDQQKRTRPRRPKKAEMDHTRDDDGCERNSETVELVRGTLRWSFEPRGKTAGLTAEQRRLLAEVIEDIIAG